MSPVEGVSSSNFLLLPSNAIHCLILFFVNSIIHLVYVFWICWTIIVIRIINPGCWFQLCFVVPLEWCTSRCDYILLNFSVLKIHFLYVLLNLKHPSSQSLVHLPISRFYPNLYIHWRYSYLFQLLLNLLSLISEILKLLIETIPLNEHIFALNDFSMNIIGLILKNFNLCD